MRLPETLAGAKAVLPKLIHILSPAAFFCASGNRVVTRYSLAFTCCLVKDLHYSDYKRSHSVFPVLFSPKSIQSSTQISRKSIDLSLSTVSISGSCEMATGTSAAFVLPKVPVPHKNFIQYIQKHPQGSIHELVNPYNAFEAKLREGFAQHRGDQALQDPNVNAVPIFGEDIEVLRVEHRRTDDETLNQKYVMPLVAKDRKPGGAPATVESIQDFKKNFNYFSESSLADLDWNNVVAAGSSVVTALLPVPDKYKDSKKAQR